MPGLLVGYLLLALTAAERASPTFDESIHLAAGYSYWTTGDYRLHAENGVLAQRALALPLVAMRPPLPALDSPAWERPAVFSFARALVFGDPGRAAGIVRAGRVTNAALAAVLALLVHAVARRRHGPAGGLLALGLYGTCPTLLAHGALATSDLAAALALFAGVLALDALVRRVSLWRVALAALALAAALLCKLNGILLVPLGAGLAAWRVWRARPLETSGGAATGGVRARGAIAGAYAGAALGCALGAWGLVWAAYGFRYEASPSRAAGSPFPWALVLSGDDVPTRALVWAREARVLPEGFLWAGAYLRKRLRANPAYLLGAWSWRGFPAYFPYCFLAKSSPALLLALGMAGALALGSRRPRRAGGGGASGAMAGLVGVVAVAALASTVNIGHRYLLPLYPPLFAIAGGAARAWSEGAGAVRAAWRAALGLVVVLALHASLSTWPHYLAYVSPLAGGTERGYDKLADSSYDWGQDLPALADWLARNRQPGEVVYLSYFGTADPRAYGIDAVTLPPVLMREWRTVDPTPLGPGIYAVSATHRLALYSYAAIGPWCAPYEASWREHKALVDRFRATSPDPRAALAALARAGGTEWPRRVFDYEELRMSRLASYLRSRAPDARAGPSILLYRLTADDLARALDGPPAECFAEVQVAHHEGWTLLATGEADAPPGAGS